MPSTAYNPYRGRIAPSPTGLLHLGHARTFWTVFGRALRQYGISPQQVIQAFDDPERMLTLQSSA